MHSHIQLIIADDHDVYRDGLRQLLQGERFEIVDEAANGKQLVDLCALHKPDIVLADIMMPIMDGIEATSIICRDMPSTRVIALSMSNEENMVVDMLRAGALGYLVKNAQKSEIIEAIYTVYQNKPFYCKATSIKLARRIGRLRNDPALENRIFFSQKELEIIRRICEEKTSRQIADELYLSARTVEEYRTRIKEKMQVRSTPGIVIYAIEHDLYKIRGGNRD
jgi:two-component system response regulator NreC